MSNKIKIILAFSLIFMSTTVFAIQKATESEKQTASKRNVMCLAEKLAIYDDHRTDAGVIAKAVVSSCESEAVAYVNILVQGVVPVDKQRIYRAIIEKNYNEVLKAILRRRATN